MFKKPFKLKLSNPVLVRTRCKFCQENPSIYFRITNSRLFLDVNKSNNLLKWIKIHFNRMCADYYLIEQPSSFHTMSTFGFSPNFKSYNPSLHHKVGVDSKRDCIDCLTCDCGRTCWYFNQESSLNRAEIVNRKSHKEYPQKFNH